MNHKDPRWLAVMVDSALGLRPISEDEQAGWSDEKRRELAYYQSFSLLLREARRYRPIPELGLSEAQAEEEARKEPKVTEADEAYALADQEEQAVVSEAWQRALVRWEDRSSGGAESTAHYTWTNSKGKRKKFWWGALWGFAAAALVFVVVGVGLWYGGEKPAAFPYYSYPLGNKSLIEKNLGRSLVNHYALASDAHSQRLFTLRLGFVLYHLEKLDRPLSPKEEGSLYRLMGGIRSGRPEKWQSWRQRLTHWAQKGERGSAQLLFDRMERELKETVALLDRGYRLAHTYYLLRKPLTVKQAMEASGLTAIGSGRGSRKEAVVRQGMSRSKALANIRERFLR